MRKKILITNNPMVIERYPDRALKVDGTPLNVLQKAMEYVMNGYVLFCSPLPPNASLFKNPYRTLVLESKKSEEVKGSDLLLLQNASTKLFGYAKKWEEVKSEVLKDYAFLDFDFLSNLLGSR